jgi:hypothetical protein
MRTVQKISIAALLLVSAGFSACQKSNTSAPNDAATLATSSARIDNESNKLEDVANAVALSKGVELTGGKLEGGGVISLLPACATVTIDTISDPHSIVIDFGSSPCLCDGWDNLYRQGVLTVTWNGPYREKNTVITYNTSNYYRGVAPDQMDQINISKTVTNIGPNENDHLVYHIVNTGSMTTFDGQSSTWTADKLKEWLEGSSTPDHADDVFAYTGSMSGTNLNGVVYNATIVSPLMKDACSWYVSGIIDIQRTNLPKVTLDYGNGICDDQATVTVNGQTKTITLQ